MNTISSGLQAALLRQRKRFASGPDWWLLAMKMVDTRSAKPASGAVDLFDFQPIARSLFQRGCGL
jgi:hypothetical protein